MSQQTRVLIADDNKDFTTVFKEYVTLYPDIGIVGIAENGSQAYEMLLQKKPDVLLLDLVMPGMDGLEVLRRIRDLGDEKPIVFVISALSNDAITRQALTLGAITYFIKPMDMESVVSKIRSLVDVNRGPTDMKL